MDGTWSLVLKASNGGIYGRVYTSSEAIITTTSETVDENGETVVVETEAFGYEESEIVVLEECVDLTVSPEADIQMDDSETTIATYDVSGTAVSYEYVTFKPKIYSDDTGEYHPICAQGSSLPHGMSLLQCLLFSLSRTRCPAFYLGPRRF